MADNGIGEQSNTTAEVKELKGVLPVAEGIKAKVYSEAEVKKLLNDAYSMAGSKHKAELDIIVGERDKHKAELQSIKGNMANTQSLLDAIKKEMEDLSSDDPEKADYLKKYKELQNDKLKLLDEQKTLNTEKQAWQVSLQELRNTEREIAIWEIAAEYPENDPVILKTLCDVAKLSDAESIKALASTLWTKNKTEVEENEKGIHIDSAITSGGGPDLNKMTPDEKIIWGLKQKKRK